MIQHYEYKIRKKKLPLTGRQTPRAARDAEELSGTVHGFRASDLEERFAKALDLKDIEYYFRFALGERGMPGWRELDFLVVFFGYHPIEVEDITFIHRGKTSEDAWKDAQVMEALKEYQPFPVVHITNDDLYDQDAANATVRRLFG